MEPMEIAGALDELDMAFSRPGLCGEAASIIRAQQSLIQKLKDDIASIKEKPAAAWMYDLSFGNGKTSINWTTAKHGDWDSILAVNIRPLIEKPE